ncbi:MAG: hypothetical protein WA584_23315 [Pyrinomonadaceae bacterium]
MPISYFQGFDIVRRDAGGVVIPLAMQDVTLSDGGMLESTESSGAGGRLESAALSVAAGTLITFSVDGYPDVFERVTQATEELAEIEHKMGTFFAEDLMAAEESVSVDLYIKDLTTGDAKPQYLASGKPDSIVEVAYEVANPKNVRIILVSRDVKGRSSDLDLDSAEFQDIEIGPDFTAVMGDAIYGANAARFLVTGPGGELNQSPLVGASQSVRRNSADTAFEVFTVGALASLSTVNNSNWSGTQLSIGNGGSGQTSANAALNAFLPSQSGNSAKFLKTGGTNTSWDYAMKIGDLVSGATANRVPFIDGSGNLAQSANLTFDGTTFKGNRIAPLGSTAYLVDGFNHGIDTVFNNGAIFRTSETSQIGTNDVFFQLIPPTTAGFGVIESYLAAAMVVGTQNSAQPVIIAPGRSLDLIRGTSGGLLIGTGAASVLGALSRTAARAMEIEGGSADWHFRIGNGAGSADYTYDFGRNYSNGFCYFKGNQSGASGFVFSGNESGVNVEIARLSASGLTLADGKDFIIGTSTGTKFGQSTSKWSFGGATPSASDTGWSVINHSTFKSFDASSDGLPELIDFVCTLAEKLLAKGIIKA